jgi:hypothetical protein
VFICVSAIALVTAQQGRGEGTFAVDVDLIATRCFGTSRSWVTIREGHHPAAGKALER